MADLGSPPVPEIGTTNHFSVELIWGEALKAANEKRKGRGPVKVILQRKNDSVGNRGDWTVCYKGLAKRIVIGDLVPKSKYHFRYQLEQKGQCSEWSPEVTVTTAREPLYAANLHMAIKKQNIDDLEEVLKSGEVSPDVENEDGFTALMVAAKKPFLEGMDLLIQYGADVDYQNKAGKTALMVACTANLLDSVKKLREYNAAYNIYDNGGCTPVHLAVDTRNVKLIEWLASDDADLNIKDHGHGGWTPLHRCAYLFGDREIGLALMMNGADIHGKDNNGNTALHLAVMRRHVDLTEVLLKRHADPLQPNKESTTPWQIAKSSDDRRRIAVFMERYVEDIIAKRKRAAVKEAQANAMQTAQLSKRTPNTVISPVQ